MSNIIEFLKMYGAFALFFIMVQVTFPIVFKSRLKERHYILYLVVFWVNFIFNVISTGILGWHEKAASRFEQSLQNITDAGFFVSLVMLFRSFTVRKKINQKER